MQGACHGNCGLEITECQAEKGRATQTMPVLQRRDLSALGQGEQASERYTSAKRESVSLSLLSVQAHLPPLSRRKYKGGPNRTSAHICHLALDLGFESPGQQFDPEWIACAGQSHDHLAGCAGRSPENHETQSLETSPDLGLGWCECLGLGRKTTGAGRS